MKAKRRIWVSLGLMVAFALWTAAATCVDVQPIGPQGSQVGFATINGLFHQWTGVHLPLYVLTDWLSLVPVVVGLGFAFLGLAQWIRRGYLSRVDGSLLALGGFYLVMLAVYILFERVVINRRPVLLNGVLEASYPSSTTVLVLCVMLTAAMQVKQRLRSVFWQRLTLAVIWAYAVLMVLGRLVSGVHWLSDIIGGVLVSAGLVTAYRVVCDRREETAKPSA